ncbi:MAG: 2'-deoxycytidine 5'-triphosphate deaminase [Devosiaceae bacterium]|nr:2'-deoxycytidine 5'-triphosphate deaminase [Devosiaceae bacterium MH13]
MLKAGAITHRTELDADQVQPASIDLRLGSVAHRIKASFLPGADRTVAERLDEVALHAMPLDDGAVLETGCIYLIELQEGLALPPEVSGATNPKSSTGRLDIFTRVITDRGTVFDHVTGGYTGPLYLEVAPQSFPVLVSAGSRLSQLRFRCGNERLSDKELRSLHQRVGLVSGADAQFHNGLAMSIDLRGDENGLIGYRARRPGGLVRVDQKAGLDRADYWEPLYADPAGTLIFDPAAFYILVSREAVHVPADYAAEMVPFDPLVGEFRVHYAGFFDPGFGAPEAGGTGARAVLEVRSREVPFLVEHGQMIGRLVFEPMRAKPSALYGAAGVSNYQAQGLKLSKHFR